MMSVMSIPEDVEQVASELQMPIDGLMQRSLRAFLMQEIRAVQLDIADFQDRYAATNLTDLRRQIKDGEIYSHPAWEDSIEWERLETYLTQLKHLSGKVSDV